MTSQLIGTQRRRLTLNRSRTIRVIRNAALCFCIVMFLHYKWLAFYYKQLTREGIIQFTHQPNERIPKQVFINPRVKCMDTSTKQTVIMVLSQASNVERRNAIRQTWGQEVMQRKYNFSLYFIVGVEEGYDIQTLNDENMDILQVDVKEHYYGITEKVIEAFNWVTHHCFESRNFFKVDDDVYFDLRVFRDIRSYDGYLKHNAIQGDCVFGVQAFRATSKFRVSYEYYPFLRYPPYCGGPGYMMTINTAKLLYEEMKFTNVFMFEDVYVGMVAFKLGIPVNAISDFIYAMGKYKVLHTLYIECARITHNLNPEQIAKLWHAQNKRGFNRYECESIPKFIFRLLFWY